MDNIRRMVNIVLYPWQSRISKGRFAFLQRFLGRFASFRVFPPLPDFFCRNLFPVIVTYSVVACKHAEISASCVLSHSNRWQYLFESWDTTLWGPCLANLQEYQRMATFRLQNLQKSLFWIQIKCHVNAAHLDWESMWGLRILNFSIDTICLHGISTGTLLRYSL